MKKRKPVKRRRLNSAPRRVNTAVSTARRRRRKKSGLSEMFTPASATAAAKDMIGGFAGGGALAVLDSIAGKANLPKIAEYGIGIGASFVAHSVLKMPNVACGITGALGYKLAKEIPMLNEDARFADDNVLADEPMFMSEDGTPMYMDENGELYSIEEGEYVEM